MTAREQWLLDKKGCFGASKSMHLLLTPGQDPVTKKPTTFGAGAMTCIQKKAIEEHAISLPEENGAVSYATKQGLLLEPLAAEHYKKIIGVSSLRYLGENNPYFKKWTAYSGASSDCVAVLPEDNHIDDIRQITKVSFGAEFKCPEYQTHGNYLLRIKDQWDLKRLEPGYYTQVQGNMAAWGADLWHWCSYSEHFGFKDMMLMIEVQPDKKLQNDLFMRITMAEKLKMEIVESLKQRNNGQTV